MQVVQGGVATIGHTQLCPCRSLPPLQVLYPTLSDYDIRFYVMEILKVGSFLLLAQASKMRQLVLSSQLPVA